MNWHKVSEELPPEDRAVLFRKPLCGGYIYFAGVYNKELGNICSYMGYDIILGWPEWTPIEPPEEINND